MWEGRVRERGGMDLCEERERKGIERCVRENRETEGDRDVY